MSSPHSPSAPPETPPALKADGDRSAPRRSHLIARLGVKAFFQKVSFGTLAIVAICMVDLFLTLVAVLAGKAIEANPLLAWSFDYGPMMFAMAKVASFIPGVWALEMCRLHNARFASMASRAVVYGYIAVYVIGSLKIHNFF